MKKEMKSSVNESTLAKRKHLFCKNFFKFLHSLNADRLFELKQISKFLTMFTSAWAELPPSPTSTLLVHMDVPDLSTDVAVDVDVASKSLGTDIPMFLAEAASFLFIDCDRGGMVMGIGALELDIWVFSIGVVEEEEVVVEFDDDDVDEWEEEEVLLENVVACLLLLSDSLSKLVALIDTICSPMLLNWFVGILLFIVWNWIRDEMTDELLWTALFFSMKGFVSVVFQVSLFF
jgi:hypothetical protein